jgi:arsenate reductase (glutaredoxin)
MATILFFEKPGCQNNIRQKAILERSGHIVEAINLLEHQWSTGELEDYLGDKPIEQCFNPAAPTIKSGKLNPLDFTKEEAMLLMIENPLLIKRPLLQIGKHRLQGFDTTALREVIELAEVEVKPIDASFGMTDMNSCPHSNSNSCITPKI